MRSTILPTYVVDVVILILYLFALLLSFVIMLWLCPLIGGSKFNIFRTVLATEQVSLLMIQ